MSKQRQAKEREMPAKKRSLEDVAEELYGLKRKLYVNPFSLKRTNLGFELGGQLYSGLRSYK